MIQLDLVHFKSAPCYGVGSGLMTISCGSPSHCTAYRLLFVAVLSRDAHWFTELTLLCFFASPWRSSFPRPRFIQIVVNSESWHSTIGSTHRHWRYCFYKRSVIGF